MKILKWILATVFWLMIIALLVAPLGLIWQISQKEQEAYMAPEAPVLQEAAVGGLAQAHRRDVSEYIVVDGTFTSTEHVYMDLNAKQAASIRWLVGIGDEVMEGQLLGTHKGKEILSTVTGVLVEMNTYAEEPYLRFQLLSPVVLEARVEDRVLSILKRSGSLATEDGEAVGLVFASARKNQDGTTSVRLTIDSDRYVYGQAVSDLRIMTGTVYRRALVLSRECVYQKTVGEEEPWYVRQVTEDGIFLQEVEVQLGFSDGDEVCVTGVSEDAWFDTGYKAVMGG